MSDVILYTTDDGKTKIDLRLQDGTAWLSQQQIADLFQTTKQNISKHIQAIYEDEELDEAATINQQLTVQKEGAREVSRSITLYNLDAILAVGYRVRSPRGVQFRRWASTVLKEYLEKGLIFHCVIAGLTRNLDIVRCEILAFARMTQDHIIARFRVIAGLTRNPRSARS